MTIIVIQEEVTTVVVNKSDIKIFEQGTQGAKGDKGDKGDTGDAGADGNDGTDGNTILSGSGAPGSGLGNDGDLYYDKLNSDIYGPKASGSWGSPTSIIGPAGAGAVDSVNGQSGIVALDADDISDDSTSHKFASSAQLTQIATNQTHAESAHAPSNAEANPATASTAEMELGTETAIRSMSPALVKTAIDEHAGSGGGSSSEWKSVFTQLQTSTDDEYDLPMTGVPALSAGEAMECRATVRLYSDGDASPTYSRWTRQWGFHRRTGGAMAGEELEVTGHDAGTHSDGISTITFVYDALTFKPRIFIQGETDAVTWSLLFEYRVFSLN